MTVLAKARRNLTDRPTRGLVHSAKGRLFNNLTKAKLIHKRQTIPRSERMLHKDHDSKGSVGKNSDCERQGAWRQDELIGGKPPVVK
jgi:hypothetical protein